MRTIPKKPEMPAIPLNEADDVLLEEMKRRMARQFKSNSGSSYDSENSAATAATAFAAIIAEQRERAVLRAKSARNAVKKP